MKNYSFACFGKKQIEIQIAKLGNNAGIIGVVLLWKNEKITEDKNDTNQKNRYSYRWWRLPRT